MATVIKCDICGETYGKHTTQPDHGCFLVYGKSTDDTCPKCTKKIKEFIDILKSSPNDCSIHIDKFISCSGCKESGDKK